MVASVPIMTPKSMANVKLRIASPPRNEDAEEHQDGRAGCHYGTAQCCVDRAVDGCEEILLGIECDVLTHTVEYDHGIVDLVSYHCQDGCDEGLVDFHCERQCTP